MLMVVGSSVPLPGQFSSWMTKMQVASSLMVYIRAIFGKLRANSRATHIPDVEASAGLNYLFA
jgi:hypothetical protein